MSNAYVRTPLIIGPPKVLSLDSFKQWAASLVNSLTYEVRTLWSRVETLDSSQYIEPGVISTASIANDAITTEKLAALSVEAAKLADSSVEAVKIANLAVGTAAIANLAVTNEKIANATITNAKIVDATIEGAKIKNATITNAHINDLSAEKITAGTLTARTLQTASSGKRFVVNASDNKAHFFGDRGDTTIEELAVIGREVSGSDFVIGSFGSTNLSGQVWPLLVRGGNSSLSAIYTLHGGSGHAIEASQSADPGTGVAGVYGSGYYYGVWGRTKATDGSRRGYGIVAAMLDETYALAPLRIVPSGISGAPSHTAGKGSLWVSSDGKLYINTDSSTTWVLVGSQT